MTDKVQTVRAALQEARSGLENLLSNEEMLGKVVKAADLMVASMQRAVRLCPAATEALCATQCILPKNSPVVSDKIVPLMRQCHWQIPLICPAFLTIMDTKMSFLVL